MKESKVLKCISYILIPILILIIILSILYEIGKENIKEENKDDLSYFQTDSFLANFMGMLSEQSNNLIFYNDRYTTIEDGEFRICYNESSRYYNDGYYSIKDYYYIIIYNNIALTNVELTTETNTVEGIKNFIYNSDGKKANIINGNVESDSEIISSKALQYFNDFEKTYYSIEEKEDSSNEDNIIENYESEEVYDAENNITYSITSEDSTSNKEYHTTSIQDFEIYTTYTEKIIETDEDIFFKMLIKQLEPFENLMMYAIPVVSVALVVICIYLIIAIGHSKDKEGIDLNDLDKIPIEIIIIVPSFIAFCILGISIQGVSSIVAEYYNLSISLLLAGYFIACILFEIVIVTTIKRIKAKTLIKDSICGRLFRWCIRIIKKIINKIKNAYVEITKNSNITTKLIIGIIAYIIIAFAFILVFNFIGFLIDLGLAAYIVWLFIERINCYKKIENHLKEMYEGNHSNKLIPSDFTQEFQDIIKYINDVSKGFENAIQEGIKSERLKTELITNVSHDIKTPLTSIINYVDLLKKENIENEKAKEYIEILDNKSQRLKKLTEDLVEASKASSGNVKLNIEKINICELIKQSTGEFEDRFKEKNLDLIYQIPDETIYIDADNRYMYRIIENLFSNISKYALENSRVYIDIKKIGNKVKIDMKNISKEKLNISADELMQRFVRGDRSRATEGSGLGISISKSLTEIQNGTFELQVDGDLFKVELEFNIV